MAFYFDTFLRIKKGVLSEINVKTSTVTYKAIITQKRKKKMYLNVKSLHRELKKL